uniref:DUF3338 domain-containing protein n=1 Tax=Rhabditophanes sp. KR3021 TaxID=114890 RepID=A0AC35UGM7_9BILA
MNHQEFLSQTSVSNLTLDKNDILRRLDLYFSKDNSLSLSKTNSTNTISSKAEEDAKTFMALKRKKIELEIELLEKLESLKSICIKEAELTGLMPKEIYLTLIKNEPLPCVNKRVGTSFKISSDILRNLTNAKENSKVVKMEADVDVLRSIAIAEKLLSRDKSVNRSVRKQRINRLNVTNDKIKAMENSLTQARNSISKPEVGSSLFMKRDNHSTISCPATPTSSLDPLKRNSRSFRTKKLFGL